jgi:hypothetical protein
MEFWNIIKIINFSLMLRFGLVRFSEMKTVNLTEPRGSPKKSSKSIQTKCDFWFELFRFAVLLLV